MLIKYQISNKFLTTTAQTVVTSGITTLSKAIVLPIPTEFYPIDYGEDVQDIVLAERKKAIGEPFDAETIKYVYPNINVNNGKGLLMQFRFWNTTSNTFTTSYSAADFSNIEIVKNRNPFKKSFFRLYFYDSNSGETSNLIFTEDLDVYATTEAVIPFNRLYWLRNDKDFTGNTNNKIVYMNASFFNAKTGKIHRFINTNVSGPPSFVTGPINIQQYSDPANKDWRTSAIAIINPRVNNGFYNFTPLVPFGANQVSTITLSEFIMT